MIFCMLYLDACISAQKTPVFNSTLIKSQGMTLEQLMSDTRTACVQHVNIYLLPESDRIQANLKYKTSYFICLVKVSA